MLSSSLISHEAKSKRDKRDKRDKNILFIFSKDKDDDRLFFAINNPFGHF